MLLVRDIMTKDIFAIDATADLELAAIALTHRGLSGAPVRDANGAFIGVVSKTDLIAPHPNSWRKRKDITVLDVMTPTVISVYADDPALHAAMEMSKQRIHRLIVQGRDGEPAGIITSMDIVRALANGAMFSVADA